MTPTRRALLLAPLGAVAVPASRCAPDWNNYSLQRLQKEAERQADLPGNGITALRSTIPLAQTP